MDNQKDTQKTGINIYGQSDVSDIKSLSNGPASPSMSQGGLIYEFANKKTEKLVTALYMVTDCMDTDDALKGKLRLLGVELLSDIYKFSILSPMDKRDFIHTPLAHIYEVLSFIEIAYTIGFISEMNTLILKNEFNGLITELKSHQSKDKHFTFTLDQKMFELPELRGESQDLVSKGRQYVKDKRTSFGNVSFTNNKSPLQNFQSKKTHSSVNILADKQERITKIISTIKDRKNLMGNQDGVSIKDISSSFTDCSEKTIQRELNSLVLTGKLKKTGAKRWSRYAMVESSK